VRFATEFATVACLLVLALTREAFTAEYDRRGLVPLGAMIVLTMLLWCVQARWSYTWRCKPQRQLTAIGRGALVGGAIGASTGLIGITIMLFEGMGYLLLLPPGLIAFAMGLTWLSSGLNPVDGIADIYSGTAKALLGNGLFGVAIGALYCACLYTPPPADRPCCRKCGYNLTGNISGCCPECGTSVQDPR
jgi:hypothetical protein